MIMQRWEKEPRKFLHCTDLKTLQRLWNKEMSEKILGETIPRNLQLLLEHLRLQVKILLGHVWIGSESGLTILSARNGKVLKRIIFNGKMKVLPEIPPEDLDHSSYAQSGVGLWDFDLVDGGKKLLVVHDIERFTPVAFDIYELS